MHELKKILEEIKNEAYNNPEIGRKQCEGMIRAMNIIRKHMSGNDTDASINDRWIPVDERMPTEEECENEYFWIILKYNTSPVIAKCSWIEANNVDGTDDSYPEFWIDQFPQIYRPSHRLIAAWKILRLPEPYRTERSDSHDRE